MSFFFYLLIGLGLYFLFRKEEKSAVFSKEGDQNFDYEAFKYTLLELTAAVMQADGHTTKAELSAFKRFWNTNYGENDTAVRLQQLKALLQRSVSYVTPCLNLTRNVNYPVRLEVLRYLFIVGSSDDLTDDEMRVLQNIAHYLNIQNNDFNSIRALFYHTSTGGRQYRQSEQSSYQSSYQSGYSGGHSGSARTTSYNNWAYTALEIEPTATDEEVKKAYRRMALKYHPDKMSGLGEAAKRTATEKFQALAEAYETIKKERGIK